MTEDGDFNNTIQSHLILGCHWGLDASLLDSLLTSIEIEGLADSVVLVVAQSDEQTVVALRQRVTVLEVDERFPSKAPAVAVRILRTLKSTRGLRKHYPACFRLMLRLLRAAPGTAIAEDLEFQLHGLQSLRYKLYLDYLTDHAPNATHIAICDLRDVVFQGDPFVGLEGLEVYLEDDTSRFTADGFNGRWIRDLYGDAELERIASEPVSCSGVTIGKRAPMIRYLKLMAEEIAQQRFPLGPHDQAVHNHLLASGLLDFATTIPNGQGRVATLGLQPDIEVDSSGLVRNSDGTVPAVVHQHDRHAHIERQINERLARLRR